MKITDQQVEMFKSLQNTEVGRLLAEFLDSFCDAICDIRNMEDLTDDARKARLAMTKLIEDEIIIRLRLSNKKETPKGTNQYA